MRVYARDWGVRVLALADRGGADPVGFTRVVHPPLPDVLVREEDKPFVLSETATEGRPGDLLTLDPRTGQLGVVRP